MIPHVPGPLTMVAAATLLVTRMAALVVFTSATLAREARARSIKALHRLPPNV